METHAVSYGKTSAVQWCSKALQSGSYIVSDFEGFRAPKHNVVGKSKKGSLLRSFMLESGGGGMVASCRHRAAAALRRAAHFATTANQQD